MFELIIIILIVLLSVDGIRRVIFALKKGRIELTASEWEVDLKKNRLCFVFLLYCIFLPLFFSLHWPTSTFTIALSSDWKNGDAVFRQNIL